MPIRLCQEPAAKNSEMYASHVESGRRKESGNCLTVFRMYDERLNTANALDFDDLLIKTVKLLAKIA
jgi:superfamily I DNA/RNA helicase